MVPSANILMNIKGVIDRKTQHEATINQSKNHFTKCLNDWKKSEDKGSLCLRSRELLKSQMDCHSPTPSFVVDMHHRIPDPRALSLSKSTHFQQAGNLN